MFNYEFCFLKITNNGKGREGPRKETGYNENFGKHPDDIVIKTATILKIVPGYWEDLLWSHHQNKPPDTTGMNSKLINNNYNENSNVDIA